MASYKLSLEAEADITRVYRYGLAQFGEVQADAYFDGLYERFQEIADKPLHYPEDDIREGYRRSVYGSDVIYYRLASHGLVEIIAILGQQDRDAWL